MFTLSSHTQEVFRQYHQAHYRSASHDVIITYLDATHSSGIRADAHYCCGNPKLLHVHYTLSTNHTLTSYYYPRDSHIWVVLRL